MNAIIKNGSKMKLVSLPKINQNIINNSKSKTELNSKNNYIIHKEEKNLFINADHNNNITPLDNKNNIEQNYVFNYEKISNNDINNILANEKSTKTDDSSGEEKKPRKIQVQTPLKLTDSKNILSSQKLNKYGLSLTLMNYISNKPNNNINNLKEILENKNDLKNNEIKKAIYYKDYNSKKEQKNYLFEKPLTDNNIIKKNKIENKDKNLYTQNLRNLDNNKVFIKNKSYDCLKRITLKNIDKINEIRDKKDKYKDDNEICHYIKVNKMKKKKNNNNEKNNKNNNKNENENKNKDLNNKIKKNKIIKNKINIKNKTYNTEFINNSNKKSKHKMNSYKKIENINKFNSINKTEQSNRKIITDIDNNKLENNIFLDKTYQNRFKNKKKNKNVIHNDIFTSDKQKEYNTFIVKKKNINNQIINSNNSSNSSNESNKDWVYRLYNQEIKKQKIKDKIILLLRKSILNEQKTENKKLAKSKTVKQFKNYNYPINEGYNIDDNFNIINLFLSDDKKMRKKNFDKKRKKIKKCQSFHSHRNKKQRRYSFDNKIEDEKINKLIEDKIYLKNHRSYKKFRLLYNEELIDEEDEEKEKDEEEQ